MPFLLQNPIICEKIPQYVGPDKYHNANGIYYTLLGIFYLESF